MKNILEPFVYAGFGFIVYKLVGYFTGYWYLGIIAGIAFIALLWLCIYYAGKKHESKNS
jgi:uncharacterized membrane protein